MVRNTEEFVEKAKIKHGEKTYGYDKAIFTKSTNKIIITCHIHGDFEQCASNHIQGQGCRSCGYIKSGINGRGTKEQFVKKAIKVHIGEYEYSKVEYIDSKTKITIICSKHGDFEQTPTNHLAKHGCPHCAGLFPLTKEVFVSRSLEKHNEGDYDYTETEYINLSTKVKIYCNKHKDFFLQPPAEHMKGKGCNECSITRLRTNEEIITEFNTTHDYFYDYSKIKYINNVTKIIIGCKLHGDFTQTPKQHKRGEGCPDCGLTKRGYYFIKRAEKHKEKWEQIPAILYFIKIKHESEEFYKIGITKNDLKERFRGDYLNIEPIKEYNTNLYNAVILETTILEENLQYKYSPKIKFEGHTECFSKNIISI